MLVAFLVLDLYRIYLPIKRMAVGGEKRSKNQAGVTLEEVRL